MRHSLGRAADHQEMSAARWVGLTVLVLVALVAVAGCGATPKPTAVTPADLNGTGQFWIQLTPHHSQMTPTLPARSRSYRDSRPRAAIHQRPSGLSRPPRIDPSTITSPAPRPSTQISPGARGTIRPTATTPLHNHSPPT